MPKFSFYNRLSISIIFVHLIILGGLAYFHTSSFNWESKRSVVVNTYVAQQETVTQVAHNFSKSCDKSGLNPVVTPKPSSQSTRKIKVDTNREKLVEMVKKSLNSLNHPSHTVEVLETKQQMGTLACESLTFESFYQDQLAAFLKNALTLPEKGNVKLFLKLNRDGIVRGITVKEGASSCNQKYVESTIPLLRLPPFEKNFKGKSVHTFSIILKRL